MKLLVGTMMNGNKYWRKENGSKYYIN
ncbi:hypothetical protein [Ruminococcus sp. zg-924]